MKHKIAEFGSLILILALAACSNHHSQARAPGDNPDGKSTLSKRIYINSVTLVKSHPDTPAIEVRISGNLPSPAYTFDRFDVSVQGKKLVITPLATYDAERMAAQVLVPFERVCKLPPLESGAYEIEVHGRGDAVVRGESIEVE